MFKVLDHLFIWLQHTYTVSKSELIISKYCNLFQLIKIVDILSL